MSQKVQVGTILMSEWPPLFGLASEPYSGRWRMLKAIDGFALDRKIRAAGWNFFLLASVVKVMFRGLPGAKKMQHAVSRILGKVSKEHFNGVEITRIVTRRFWDSVTQSFPRIRGMYSKAASWMARRSGEMQPWGGGR